MEKVLKFYKKKKKKKHPFLQKPQNIPVMKALVREAAQKIAQGALDEDEAAEQNSLKMLKVS